MTTPTEAKLPRLAAEEIPALQATLVELLDLSLDAKQAHWNVIGPGFKPVHVFLDELTDQYRDWYDTVAERMTAIGVSPDGRSATVAATSPLGTLPAGAIADQAALAAMDERVTLVASNIQGRIDSLGDLDLATQDVFIEVLRGLEKQRWMLRAHRA
ncbi:MAG TPA: DNA starvation/stationary phase protection protein [Candidatus Baltobacteraceae bacterium]|nr:DNA starvation/stationary phase protection protein [Candidatus Baltobacteraceae bacterium]